jgi:hypothetical protein
MFEGESLPRGNCLSVSDIVCLPSVNPKKRAADKNNKQDAAVAVVRRSSNNYPLEQGEAMDHDPVPGVGVGCGG